MGLTNETLIVIYRSLLVGGIENYVASVIKNALTTNKRVIWICNTEKLYSPVYKEIVEDKKMEIITINFSGINIYKLPKIDLSQQEKVKVMVFDIFRLFQAYKLKEKYKETKIDILYCVPHFTGSSIFPEQCFVNKTMNSFIQNKYSIIYNKLFKNGTLYFFSSKHYETIQQNYGINFSNPQNYLVPQLRVREMYDEEVFRKVFRSNSFTIISPGRFEFPHKGFLLGLIQVYGKLKPIYPKLRLLIIGDGQDKDKVEEAILKLPKESRSGIEIKNSMSFDELLKIMKTVNLNISVAGCASMGAKIGLITLPARHYNYDCEVYGFYPESRYLTTETKPGFPVEPYIERIINMSEDEYIHYSKLAYHSFDDELYNPNFPFGIKESTDYIPTKIDSIFVKLTYNIHRVFYLFNNLRRLLWAAI